MQPLYILDILLFKCQCDVHLHLDGAEDVAVHLDPELDLGVHSDGK